MTARQTRFVARKGTLACRAPTLVAHTRRPVTLDRRRSNATGFVPVGSGLFLLALWLLLGSIEPALAAQYVVAEARGIGISVGSVIDPAAPLALKRGQHLVLISDDGATIKLDGPYSRAPAGEKGVQLAAAFSSLATERNARMGEIGTTRGAAPRPPLPQPWLIDPTSPGTACVLQNRVPVFWRPTSASSLRVVIAPADHSWRAQTIWPAGSERLNLTPELGVHGDASYFVALNGSESAIAIATVPPSLSTDAMRAAWMIQKGCDRQAEALVRASK